jgi:hypothetical protein
MGQLVKSLGMMGLMLGIGANALAATLDQSPNRFKDIEQRNAFGLTAQPLPPALEPPLISRPKLILTGITTVLGDKRVLLKEQTPSGKGEAETSLILTEGEKSGPIQVLMVDVAAGRVQVNNSGTVMMLTFEKNGPKAPSATATPTPLPGEPGNPSVVYGTNAGFAFQNRNERRNLRGAFNQAVPSLIPTGAARAPGGTGTGAETSPAPRAVPAPAPSIVTSSDLTPEEQAVILELQREATRTAKRLSGLQAAPATNSLPSQFRSPQTIVPNIPPPPTAE